VTGFYPTSLWAAGEYVRDQVDLPINEEAPAGSYTLRVGMYDAGTGERMPVQDSAGQIVGDSVSLEPVQVERP
jgi:hypothetical protein